MEPYTPRNGLPYLVAEYSEMYRLLIFDTTWLKSDVPTLNLYTMAVTWLLGCIQGSMGVVIDFLLMIPLSIVSTVILAVGGVIMSVKFSVDSF